MRGFKKKYWMHMSLIAPITNNPYQHTAFTNVHPSPAHAQNHMEPKFL